MITKLHKGPDKTGPGVGVYFKRETPTPDQNLDSGVFDSNSRLYTPGDISK